MSLQTFVTIGQLAFVSEAIKICRFTFRYKIRPARIFGKVKAAGKSGDKIPLPKIFFR